MEDDEEVEVKGGQGEPGVGAASWLVACESKDGPTDCCASLASKLDLSVFGFGGQMTDGSGVVGPRLDADEESMPNCLRHFARTSSDSCPGMSCGGESMS